MNGSAEIATAAPVKNNRKLHTIIALLTTLLLLGAVAVFCVLPKLATVTIKQQIADIGEDLFGDAIYVEDASCNIWNSKLYLYNVILENPEGYSSPTPAIQVESIEMQLKLLPLLKRELHLKKLAINGTTINVYLQKIPASFTELVMFASNPQINLFEFTRNARKQKLRQQYRRQRSPNTKSSQPWLIKIDDLQVNNSRVLCGNLKDLKFLPLEIVHKYLHFPLPDIHRQDLGKDSKLTANMLAKELFSLQLQVINQKRKQCMEDIKIWFNEQKKRVKDQKQYINMFKNLFKKKNSTAAPTSQAQ